MTSKASGRTPQRTCVGCRRTRPRLELVRLALSRAPGRVTLDPHCRLPGRGAYICRETGITCLREAARRRSLARSLRVGSDVIDEAALAVELGRLQPEVST
ncbi:MAG: YlxR family protein [Chloroflexi bacterium]|nr:MAG: YlxR family protein [Chloroflexota bacterium]